MVFKNLGTLSVVCPSGRWVSLWKTTRFLNYLDTWFLVTAHMWAALWNMGFLCLEVSLSQFTKSHNLRGLVHPSLLFQRNFLFLPRHPIPSVPENTQVLYVVFTVPQIAWFRTEQSLATHLKQKVRHLFKMILNQLVYISIHCTTNTIKSSVLQPKWGKKLYYPVQCWFSLGSIIHSNF